MRQDEEVKLTRNDGGRATPQDEKATGKSLRDHVATSSGDIVESQVWKLRSLFPEAFVDGKIDLDKLRATLGAAVELGPDRFNFTWAGKHDAIALLQVPSRGTLLPIPDDGINPDSTGNVFIEGDNLEVLKILFKAYFGRVKVIYIDPPYNTGQDFVYPDNYADPLKSYLQLTGQIDSEGNLLTSNPETSGRYHSAWLSMMYPRLFLAKQLLREDGVIFISIDDHEMHHLRLVMNEIFGEENFIACFVWQRRQVSDNRNLNNVSTDHEYVLAYSQGSGILTGTAKDLTKYSNPDDDPRGPWMSDNLTGLANREQRPNLHYDIVNPETRKSYPPLASRGWAYDRKAMDKLISEQRILWPAKDDGRPRLKRFLNEIRSQFTGFSSIQDFGFTTDGTRTIEELFGEKIISFPKPVELPRRLCEQATSPNGDDIVLDFFAGSCTTAQAVMELNRADGGNRKFICVQLPEPTNHKEFSTIADMGKERIRRVIAKMRREGRQLPLDSTGSSEDLGFKAFRLAAPSIQCWTPDENHDPDVYVQKLSLFNDPLVAGWNPESVVWEVALREGFGLRTSFSSRELPNGNRIYEVLDSDTGQSLTVCLDDAIRADLSKHFDFAANALFICRDIALDDSAAANLALQCRLKTI